MKRKEIYITPGITVIGMDVKENIAQFIISSQSIGEDSGEAKEYFYEEEEEEENGNAWGL